MVGMARSLALGILALGIANAAAQDRRGEPGQFDYYVLSLSWSPSFCETASGRARDQQCGPRPYSFVVHGLWPQYERGFPEACEVPAPRLNRGIVEQMLDLMPARGLVYHEWDAHGTCSGLGARDYFDLVRKARAAVTVPPAYQDTQQPLIVTPAEVVDAFVQANAGLAAEDVAIDCDRTRLREVRICLNRDLKFRACNATSRRACRSDKLRMPPVRGG
jgi:ribonuclease T2